MKNYEYILFDWDGTLAKTLDVWLDACRNVLNKRSFNFSDDEIATCFGIPVQRFKEWGVKDVETAISEMEVEARANLDNVELYTGAQELLLNLYDQGKKIALITTSKHDFVKHLLQYHNMERFFSIIIAGDDVNKHKPDPEPLEKAIYELNGNKDQSIIIGDSNKDLGAALNTGIDSILFYPPEHAVFYKLEDLESYNPTYKVNELKEITSIIAS